MPAVNLIVIMPARFSRRSRSVDAVLAPYQIRVRAHLRLGRPRRLLSDFLLKGAQSPQWIYLISQDISMFQNTLLKASHKSPQCFRNLQNRHFIQKMSLTTASTLYPPRILVIGAAYGGLSTVMNLLNLCDGKPQLHCPLPLPSVKAPKIAPLISMLDERDGICEFLLSILV